MTMEERIVEATRRGCIAFMRAFGRAPTLREVKLIASVVARAELAPDAPFQLKH